MGVLCIVCAKSDTHFASVFGAGTTHAGTELTAGRAKHDLFEYRATGFVVIIWGLKSTWLRKGKC